MQQFIQSFEIQNSIDTFLPIKYRRDKAQKLFEVPNIEEIQKDCTCSNNCYGS